MDFGLAILQELFDKGPVGLDYDLKPFIKSLKIERDTLIKILSNLEKNGFITGDNRWHELRLMRANNYVYEFDAREIILNFQLTPSGKNYCIEMKRGTNFPNSQSINVGNNSGNILQATGEFSSTQIFSEDKPPKKNISNTIVALFVTIVGGQVVALVVYYLRLNV